MTDVSILIVSYNAADWLERCLAAIGPAAEGVDVEVVLVDNNSTDLALDVARAVLPHDQVVALDENIGFGRAVNLAAKQATGEYLLLLNPDAVLSAGSVGHLVRLLRAHPEFGTVGGRTLTPAGDLNPSSCWGLQSSFSLLCFATGLSTLASGSRLFDPESLGSWQRDSVREVGFISGCLLLVSAELWAEVGGFDERYFMYGEDQDLGLRVRAAGYTPTICPDAVAVHAVGASSAKTDKMSMVMRARATLVRDHWHEPRRALGLASLRAGTGVRALAEVLLGRRGLWRSVWSRRREWIEGWTDRQDR